MNDHVKRHRLAPGKAPGLAERDPGDTPPDLSHGDGKEELEASRAELERLQRLLYADRTRALLVVLQGPDAAGKDGVIRHVFTGMNPQGVRVSAFKQPTPEEAAHDFLWRIHKGTPGKGEVAIFNRSHYEDVLVVRVHGLVPEPVWRARYDRINAFESLVAASGTRVLKFFLHISKEEQLRRFAKRLEDPARQWKISEADYTERGRWDAYLEAYEEALLRTSTEHAPWFVIPSDHKWYRNLAIARIICAAMDEMKLAPPPPGVDLDDIRRRYHAAEAAQSK